MNGEEGDKDPTETCEQAESEEVKNGVPIKDEDEAEGDPGVEVGEEAEEEVEEVEEEEPTKSHPPLDEEEEEEEVEEEKVEESQKSTPQRMIILQKDLTALVTNIQTAADAKESMRRTELEEARKIRLERLENSLNSSQKQLEEIVREWSVAKEEVIPQELQEALNNLEDLYSALIDKKKKLICDLQQELKVADDRYVKDLRKHAEELDLMMERMDEQINILIKAYREELVELERIYQQESEVFLAGDKTEYEQDMEKLWDKEIERVTQRKKQVEENEHEIHNLLLDAINRAAIQDIKQEEINQIWERENQETKGSNMLVGLKAFKQKYKAKGYKYSRIYTKRANHSLKMELRNLEDKYANQMEEFTKRSSYLSEDHNRNIQQYQRIQKKMKPFAAADARHFKEMWLMIEAEVKQLVEKALVIDSLICKQHLGLSWERPRMIFMDLSSPTQPEEQAHESDFQLVQTGPALQRLRGLIKVHDESTGMKESAAGTEVQSKSGAEAEELLTATLKKVIELLCDEAGFVMEDKLLKLLGPLEKQEQTVVKLGSLISSLGIEKEDLPELALFLLKYTQQQTEPEASSVPTEAAETSSATNLSSDLIHPNDVLPALKSFLEQHMRSRESSLCQQSSVMHFEALDSSEHEAYWQSMGNIISKDRFQLWEAAEKTLKQHLSVLTEISELIPETNSLKEQNTELRLLLQQSLT